MGTTGQGPAGAAGGPPRRARGLPPLAAALALLGTAAVGVLAGTGEGAVDAGVEAPPTPPRVQGEVPDWTTYPHGGVYAVQAGSGPTGALLFEPLDPRPAEAPLIVFLHGWAALSPAEYGAWIDHLVRQGNVVVFPRWQHLASLPGTFQPNALAGIRAALEVAAGPERVRLDLGRVAVVGHSMGGLLAANYAAVAAAEALPRPRAVFCVQPGLAARGPRDPMPELEDLSRIPADTLFVALAGDVDDVTGTRDAKRILRAATRIPWARKAYVFLLSDDHGEPELRADHLMPLGRDRRYETSALARVRGSLSERRDVDALDQLALWRPFDRLCAAAFADSAGHPPDIASWFDLGSWSDGTPVAEPLVLDLGVAAEADD